MFHKLNGKSNIYSKEREESLSQHKRNTIDEEEESHSTTPLHWHFSQERSTVTENLSWGGEITIFRSRYRLKKCPCDLIYSRLEAVIQQSTQQTLKRIILMSKPFRICEVSDLCFLDLRRDSIEVTFIKFTTYSSISTNWIQTYWANNSSKRSISWVLSNSYPDCISFWCSVGEIWEQWGFADSSSQTMYANGRYLQSSSCDYKFTFKMKVSNI